MAVTYRTSSAGGATSGTGNRTSTIAALTGDLLIVYVQWSGNSATNPTCTDNGTGTNTYTLIGTALNNASGDICALFIRNVAVAAGATLTISPVVGSGTNTAGEIITIAYAGATNFGSSALRSVSGTPQFGKQANQTSGVPTPVLPAAALTANPTLTSCGSSTTAGSVPNASWTERQDAAQATPTTSMEVATRDSGFTGTSAAYVSVASSVWNSMIIELDSSLSVSVAAGGQSIAATAGTAMHSISVAAGGQSIAAAAGAVTEIGNANVGISGSSITSTAGTSSEFGDANVSTSGAGTSFDFGFDFRATSGFVTDPSYAAPVLGEAYPHTYTNGASASITAGWSVNQSSVQTRDRSAGVPVPLAGLNENSGNNTTPSFVTFRIDLPSAGVWSIVMSCGDQGNPQTVWVKLLDNGVSFVSYPDVSVPNDEFEDASGNIWSQAAWTGSNVPLVNTFSSTLFTLQLGPDTVNADTTSSVITHLRITKTAAGNSIAVTEGSVTATPGVTVVASGDSITPSVGSVTVTAGGVTVAATGSSATLTAGTVSESGTANVTSVGSALTSTVGTVAVSTSVSIAATGNSLSSGTGTVAETGTAAVAAVGSSFTSTAGSVTKTGTANVASTGSSATFTAGTVSVTTTVSVSVSATGASATFSVGNSTETGTAPAAAVGSSITSTAGSVAESGAANVVATGTTLISTVGSITESDSASVAAVGSSVSVTAGTVSETGTENVTSTGQSLTITEGTVSVIISVSVSTTGNSITSASGTVTETGTANIAATGDSLSTTAGTVSVSAGGSITVGVTGSSITITEGSVSEIGDANVAVTGSSVTSTAGTVTESAAVNVSVTGSLSVFTSGTITASGSAAVLATSNQSTTSVGTVTVTVGHLISANIQGSSSVVVSLTGIGELICDINGMSIVIGAGIGLRINAAIINAANIIHKINLLMQSIAPAPQNTSAYASYQSVVTVSDMSMMEVTAGEPITFSANVTTGIALRNCIFAVRGAVPLTAGIQIPGGLQQDFNLLLGAYQQWIESIPLVNADNQS